MRIIRSHDSSKRADESILVRALETSGSKIWLALASHVVWGAVDRSTHLLHVGSATY